MQILLREDGGATVGTELQGENGRAYVIALPQTSSESDVTLSNESGSASSKTLLSANSSRKGFIIFNDSSAFLYVKFGATASTSSFTYRVSPFAHLEHLEGVIYTGVVDGIWASATGDARITEL